MIRLHQPSALMCAVAILCGGNALALELPRGVTQGPSMEGITEYRLPNGLKVLLFPDASKPTVTVNMTYLVGSRHENYGETGMAHLLEHLLFKGATGYTDITKEFSTRGMRFNGTTSTDRTNYYESFKADDGNLKWAVNMEAARMTHSFVARKALDSEMTVVRNEFEMGENNPGNVLFKRMQSISFDWHANGHSTIGNRSDIEHVRIENLQNFYRTWYQPDNAVLLVTGKFDSAKTLAWITSAFAAVPKPKRTLPEFWTVEPAQDGERSFTVRRKGDYQMIALGYKIPAEMHADVPALNVLTDILGDNPNGRLHKQLVVPGKAVQVFSFNMTGAEPGLHLLGAVVKKDGAIEPVRDVMVAAAESFAKEPPTAAEVQRAQRQNANYYEKMLNDPERFGVTLSNAIALGDWRTFFYNRDRYAKVTPEQVGEVAARYLKKTSRVVGNFLPDDDIARVEIAGAPSAATALANYTNTASVQAGEDFDPAPANIDKRTRLSTVGGLKLALLPKKTRGAMVSVRLNLHWGDEQSLFGKSQAGGMAGAMLERGTTRYTREQLADEMDKLKISGNIYNFTTTREHLPAALRLVGHILKEPSFPESEFEQLRQLMIVSTEAGRNEPQAVAQRAKSVYFNRYPKGDPRAATTLEEDLANLKTVTLADVKAYHHDFYGASQGDLAVVGDFDADQVAAVTKEVFGDWKSRAPYQHLDNKNFGVAAKTEVLNTPDKENAVYSARIDVDIAKDDPDYPALVAANYIFGSGGLKSRLMDRIRQKDGLSYGAGSNISVPDRDRAGSFDISAIAAPKNMNKVATAVREELARALKDGFTVEEVANAKSGLLQLEQQARAQDRAVANKWAGHLYNDKTFAWEQKQDEAIARLTVEQVNAAFRKAVDPARMSVFMAGDTAKGVGGAAP